jgi:hypothetical protein
MLHTENPYLAQLRILNNSAIAAEFLLKILEYLVVVVFLSQALDSGQTLPAVALLGAYMHVFLCASICIISTCICKGIW